MDPKSGCLICAVPLVFHNDPRSYHCALCGDEFQAIKMHGPEHHYLVPAMLLNAFYNKKGQLEEKSRKLRLARQRAEDVLADCPFHS